MRLLDYGPGYGSGYVGPVIWQLRSHRGAHLERVTVGRVPAGFEEQVDRLPLPGPSELTVVTDPYGEDAMSFYLRNLRRNRVYRADYVYLPLSDSRRARAPIAAGVGAHTASGLPRIRSSRSRRLRSPQRWCGEFRNKASVDNRGFLCRCVGT